MQNHDCMHRALSVVLCFLLTSCATTNVPPHWLSEPEQTASDGYGGWINIELRENRIAGELIAISEDTVFIADSVFHAVCSKDILSARLVSYNAPRMGGYVILGTVSTLSNGWACIFTAPMWIIGGSIAVILRTYEPIIDYPDRSLATFIWFARYPQGLSPNLNRGLITMKPHK
jgi:hypothetical protein